MQDIERQIKIRQELVAEIGDGEGRNQRFFNGMVKMLAAIRPPEAVMQMAREALGKQQQEDDR